jgi:hypothetical protein
LEVGRIDGQPECRHTLANKESSDLSTYLQFLKE